MTREQNEQRFIQVIGAVKQLYTKEGRSKVYISNLLGIDRWYLREAIVKYEIEEPQTKRRLTKSTEKFLNRNREKILKMLNEDKSESQIGAEFDKNRDQIHRIIQIDDVLKQAEAEKLERIHRAHQEHVQYLVEKSGYDYNIVPIEEEVWKPMPGYDEYDVSNMGRIRKHAARYDAYYLLTPQPNKNNGRMYVSVVNNSGKRKNISLARVVASQFCDGFSDERKTVNHIDGDVQNNRADNLEWVSQSDNNKHSYQMLNRPVDTGKPIDYVILYKDKYEFKTIAAFARFINKSWTQASRWLGEPEKHEIKKIYHKKALAS